MTFEELQATLPMSHNVAVLSVPLCVDLGCIPEQDAQRPAKAGRIPNRLAIQAMEGADGTADGAPGELTIRRYERFAKSGAGLLWFEATAVKHESRANPRQLFLNEKNADVFKRLVDDMRTWARSAGTEPMIILQATHSGRYSKPDGTPAPLIACNNPIYEGANPLPSKCIITDNELRRIEEDYGKTTKLAVDCGFDGLDVKACHRYLNSELLGAFTRPGPYGGSLENRMRFFKNCVANARASAPIDFIVTSRMNIYDAIPYPYGFGVQQAKENTAADIAATESGTHTKRLREQSTVSNIAVFDANQPPAPDLTEPISVIRALRLPIINITMGNPYFNPQVNRPTDLAAVERMYELTRQIGAAVETPIVSSAPTFLRENSPYLAAGAVEEGYADIIGYGRMAFAYPNFARDTLNDCFDKKQCCITCGKCTELMRGLCAGCAVRDKFYTELYVRRKKAQ